MLLNTIPSFTLVDSFSARSISLSWNIEQNQVPITKDRKESPNVYRILETSCRTEHYVLLMYTQCHNALYCRRSVKPCIGMILCIRLNNGCCPTPDFWSRFCTTAQNPLKDWCRITHYECKSFTSLTSQSRLELYLQRWKVSDGKNDQTEDIRFPSFVPRTRWYLDAEVFCCNCGVLLDLRRNYYWSLHNEPWEG